MRLRQSWIGILCVTCACTEAPAGMNLESVIARHVDARGGAAAIEAVRTYEAELRIAEPTFEVDGRYVATRDGRMRVDISIDGERVFTEALDEGRAWSWTPDQGVGEGSTQGAAALRHGIELPIKLFGLHEMQGRGHRLEFVGSETIDGIEYRVLRLTLDDGFETAYYVNPDTWLIERDRQLRALHVDVDPTAEWIETAYEDHRPINGVMYAHRQVERQVASGAVLSTVTIRTLRVNPPLEPGRFSPP